MQLRDATCDCTWFVSRTPRLPIGRLVVPNPFGIRSGTQPRVELGDFA